MSESGWSGKTETYHEVGENTIFYTRFDKVQVTINPTKFPVDLQGTFQQDSTSFYTVTE